MILRILFLLIFSFQLISTAFSQKDIKFQHFTVKEGLSQNTIICILQDRQGFMWFGTQDGLNRYDGYKFTIYRHDPEDSASLPDNFIVFLAEDTSGTLWVGTLESENYLYLFNPKTETFKHFPADSVNLSGARINTARSKYQDRSGIWWYGLRNEGLKRFNPKNGKTVIYKNNPADKTSLSNDDVYQIAEDQNGFIWLTTSGGLNKFDMKTESFLSFKHDYNNPNSLSDDETWPLLIDRQGILWIGTYNGGLNRYDPQTGKFKRYRHHESDPFSIAGDRLHALYQDRSGVIWIGTGDNGLDCFHPELSAFDHYMHDPDESNSLINNNVQSLCVDGKGNLWIGTRGGLNRLDRVTNSFKSYTHDRKNTGSIVDDIPMVLFTDRSGVLWVGTQNSGLDRMNADGTFTHYKYDPSNSQSISEDGIYALCEDRKGNLWIGTYGGGLNCLENNRQTFRRYKHDPADSSSLGAEGVWSLLIDREGVLWVGTYRGGLDRFDGDKETFTHFRHKVTDSTSISDDIILCLYEDRKGNIWAGTNNGLNRFDRSIEKFERFSNKDGLPNNVIFGILEDSEGNLWMSTNKGISKFNPQAKTFVNYDITNGLQGNEFNQGAYAKDLTSGKMFFGGASGLNAFIPENVKTNPYVPPVVITAAIRYNTDDEEGRPIEERGIFVKSSVNFSYKDNIISFEFASLNYLNSHKNQYMYQLEGFSNNWIYLDKDRRATFTNLDGGEYFLRVKGSNNDGIWNDQGTMLRIVVDPPWWKTKWAYGSYSIMFIALLYGLRRFELNRQMQKAKIRESELHSKAIEAEKRILEVENERKTKELDDARQLQLSMLPKEVPNLQEYEIAVFMKTATEVGGDYYDFSISPEGNLTMALGDATGHGMQAGTIVTLIKGLFVSDASKSEIDAFFNHCNRAVKNIRLGRLYMALTVAKFVGKNVYLSSAGMPPAYLYRKNSGTVDEILMKAVPIGAMKNYNYTIYETEMAFGDTLLFLTDGLPEQKNSKEEMYDYSRIIECFRHNLHNTPADIIAHLVKEIEGWMDGIPQDDDITLMVIRKKEIVN